MATKIKVKKITDLTLLPAEDTEDVFGNNIPGAQDIDQIIVAHNTNVNSDSGDSIVHTNAMQLGELLKYVDNDFKSRYMSAQDGEQLKDEIEQRLREAEENMSKGNDTYSGNYFIDDSGIYTFPSDGWKTDKTQGEVVVKYTDDFVFKSTGSANCHLTIYRGSINNKNIPIIKQAPAIPLSYVAYAKIMMESKSGWKSICQQPLQNAGGAFTMDLHGYFYAGTKIKGAIVVQTDQIETITDTSLSVIPNMSGLQVTRFSSDKGFPEKSFDWLVTNENATKSSKIPGTVLSGFFMLKFNGLYYHGKVDKNGKCNNGMITAHYGKLNNKKTAISSWVRHYRTDAVYARIEWPGSGNWRYLGNTENASLWKNKAGVLDDFSGKYYYVSADADSPVSVYTETDFVFNDDAKGNYADRGGGWHNSTLISYVDYDELSTVAGLQEPEGWDGQELVYHLSSLTFKFSEQGNYHRFKYSGGYGMYHIRTLSNDATTNRCSQFLGRNARNTAKLDITSDENSVGCYCRETMERKNSPKQQQVYSFIPTTNDGQTIHTIIKDYWKNNKEDWGPDGKDYPLSVQGATIYYTLDVLNENIKEIGVGPDVYKLTTGLGTKNAITKGGSKDAYKYVDSYLCSEVSVGWALTDVDLVSSANEIMIRDFGFAACPRLKKFEFKKGISFTGRYTFAAPSKPLSSLTINEDTSYLPVMNSAKIGRISNLHTVKFWAEGEGDDREVTHVYGNSGDGEMYATFAYCIDLSNINLQDTDAQALGTHTFLCCTSLLSIEVPQTCKKFGGAVFNGCAKLSNIILPSSINAMDGGNVFLGCSALTAANKYNTKTTKRSFVLGQNYNMTIKLLSSYDGYIGDGTLNKGLIWSEISSLVNCLQTQKAGWTAKNNAEALRQGRRFYIVDKEGQRLQTDNGDLTFNTISENNNAKGFAFSAKNLTGYDVSDNALKC